VIIPTFRTARGALRGEATLAPAAGSKSAPMVRFRLPRLGLVAASGLVLVLLPALGCTASSEEVRPPQNELFFPTGVAVSPDESHLFVTSANSEPRYDSGVLSAVDLAAVDAVIEGWLARDEIPAGCERDLDFGETLVCGDETFLLAGKGVRTGNFATAMAVQDLGEGNLRLVIPVRGDPSVTWVDWRAAEGRLACADSAEGFALCDDAHRLTEMRNDGDLPDLVDEPFGVYTDSGNDYAVVTHVALGGLTLVDSPRGGSPQLVDALQGLFAERGNTEIAGAVAVAGRTPGQPGNLVYVAGRTENKVIVFSIERPPGEALPLFIPSDVFPLRGIGADPSDTRGLAFDASGSRMFVVNRLPPMLHVYDTALTSAGYPKNELIAGADLCTGASNIVVADAGEGERVYISCFINGQVWVVDPRGLAVESFIQVGRGPYGIAVAPGRRRLYVSNFLEDTLAVIDLTPGAVTRNRVVLRIGEPRQ
jgi:DNA-binding beta-propeller fold protein YncE